MGKLVGSFGFQKKNNRGLTGNLVKEGSVVLIRLSIQRFENSRFYYITEGETKPRLTKEP